MSLQPIIDEVSSLKEQLAKSQIELAKHRVAASDIYAATSHLVFEIVKAATINKLPYTKISVPATKDLSFDVESKLAVEALSISRMIVATLSAGNGPVNAQQVSSIVDSIREIKKSHASGSTGQPLTSLSNISVPLRKKMDEPKRPVTPPNLPAGSKDKDQKPKVSPLRTLSPQRSPPEAAPKVSDKSSPVNRASPGGTTFITEGQALAMKEKNKRV